MKKQFYGQPYFATAFIIAMAMVAVEVSPWIAIFSFVLLVWKWGVEKNNWKPLNKKISSILSIVLLLQVLIQYRSLIGQEPSYTFLLGLSALRVMDYENERDHKFVILLGFILISIKALFSIDIYWIVPSGFAFAGMWYALLPQGLPYRLKTLLTVFVVSIPLALILFIAFPRIVFPWAMSRSTPNTGQIGFSDDLNPGSVSSIAENPSMAFRAKLSSLPTRAIRDLYWRGSVLTRSRGLSWSPDRPSMRLIEQESKNLPTYEVALEPTSQVYLFTLDGSQEVQLESGSIYAFDNGVFRATRPMMSATAYRVSWDPNWKDTVAPREEDLQHPRLQGRVADWVNTTAQTHKDIPGRLEALKELFFEGDFSYTLNPGFYGPNDLELFLFDRRVGFCEHFAGAYATLARGLGIPARVVIGYQGGRYNPLGDFWRIGQRDAHAWVEVYTEGQWTRVDPTQWIAPLRLLIGGEEFFSLSEEDQRTFAKSIDWRPSTENRIAVWDQMTFWFEDLNYRWSYFLIDFDRSSQRSFWQQLLQHRLQTLMAVVIMLLASVYIFRSLFRHKDIQSEEQVLLAEIQKWGELRKLPQLRDEAPLTYINRLKDIHPSHSEVLQECFEYYDRRVYAKDVTAQSIKGLIQKLRYRVGEER